MYNKKNGLKLPKGLSEAVIRRRTDNTMDNRKRTKKTKDLATETPLKQECISQIRI